MYKYLPVPAASKMSVILFIAMSSTLAACSNGELALDDTYVPAAHYERFPIEVPSGPVRMEVSSRHGTLQSSQINAISGFSRSASNSGSSRITVLRPSAGGASGKVARQVYQVLVQSGISPGMIVAKNLSRPVQGIRAAFLHSQRCRHQGMRRLVGGYGQHITQRVLSEFWLLHAKQHCCHGCKSQ